MTNFVTKAKSFLPFLSEAVQTRCDSIAFARSFEHIEQELQETEFSPMLAEELIPYDTSAPDGAVAITHRIVTQLGQAEFIDQYADDLPAFDVKAEEFSVKTELLGGHYFWTVEELDRVAMDPTVRLDAERRRSAEENIRRKHDEIAFIGSTELGRTGFLNDANVPLVSPVTGTWSGATTDQIIEDIQTLIDSVMNATDDNHRADTLLVGSAEWTILNKPYGDAKDYTLRKWLLENVDGLKEIKRVSRLDLADVAGTGPRLVAYKKDKSVVKYNAVITYRERSPQDSNLKVKVPCYGKTGFTEWRKPLAGAYMDGI